ncbi:MAG: hypothetical protein KY475_26825 [Planctomycetes bacterium]|nr:hypothetical protein [Planctomycetota bacterium]
MSMATYEQRLQALEAAVADLRSARQADRSGEPLDGFPPGAEQRLLPGVPPKHAVRLRARLTGVEPAPQDLGLSQSEWAALNLEAADE